MREVLGAGRARFALVGDAFAEQIERGGDALGVERAHRGERFVERLSGDEARRELLGEFVVPNEAEDRAADSRDRAALSGTSVANGV